jgi:hypothetical protein
MLKGLIPFSTSRMQLLNKLDWHSNYLTMGSMTVLPEWWFSYATRNGYLNISSNCLVYRSSAHPSQNTDATHCSAMTCKSSNRLVSDQLSVMYSAESGATAVMCMCLCRMAWWPILPYPIVSFPFVSFRCFSILFLFCAVLCCAVLCSALDRTGLIWSGLLCSDDIASLMVTCMLCVTPVQIFRLLHQRLHQLLHRRLHPYQ